MTFVEAAIEILKREGKPLSSRRLAELAVKLNLLSVVGRDPGTTMQERLDDALDRQARHPDLLRLQPDTFGLHSYPPRPYPVAGNGAPANGAAEGAAEEAGGEPKKGRRRRRRGRRNEDGEGADTAGAAGAEAGGAEAEGADGEGEEGAESAAAEKGAEGAAEAAAAEGATADKGGAGKDAGTEGAEGAPAGEKRRRRRRGGRGRRRREGGGDVAGTEAAAGDEAGDEGEGEGEEGGAEAPRAAREPLAAVHEGELPPSIPEELPSEAAAAGTPAEELSPGEAAAPGDDAELLDESDADEEVDEIDEHTGPLLAPALGAEDVTRTEDDRVVRPEIFGSRDDRRRDRHRERPRDRHKDRGDRGERKHHERGHEAKHEGRAPEGKHEGRAPEGKHEGRGHEGKHEPRAHEARPHQEARPSSAPPEPRTGGLIDTLLDILRATGGGPMHVRQLADAVAKRKGGDPAQANDLPRLARAALVREQRDRDAEGLRPRVRPLGGGNYATPDRKLDPELLQAERDLAGASARLREATRAAVRRRLGRMSPAAFDALGRTLADKLGITGLELLRRGEGVTYWGGTRPAGVGTVRTLVAFRAGEGEVNRRAVGELRAGLAAKGYDEGILLSAGRPNGEAIAELKAGGVTLYDGAALAALVIKHGLGVRRVTMPVDYLDVEFFAELQEG